jgi:hypothetical protein
MIMGTRDDVTVRIDTELREKAREHEINLSRLLEGALREEVERLETIAQTLEGSQTIRLDLLDGDERSYVGKFEGVEIAATDYLVVYLAADGRLIIYDSVNRQFYANPDNLAAWFPYDPGVLAEVLHAIGETPEIEI